MMSNGNGVGHSILETTKFRWSEDKDVKHFVLTVLASSTPDNLRFQALEVPPPGGTGTPPPHVGSVDEMGAYAVSQADLPRPGGVGLLPSPLDLHGIKDQCWVLIRLDPAVNWQFTVGEKPCTLKDEDLKGSNISLRHVFAGDSTVHDGEVALDGCRTIFFGVVQRAKRTSSSTAGPASCFVNLNVEFLQSDSDGPKRLQIIVDPDVPNDGTDGFPS